MNYGYRNVCEWIETLTRHRVRLLENLVHNEPTVVERKLRNFHLPQLTKINALIISNA